MAFTMLACYRVIRPTPRQALPLIGATDIHEYTAVNGFLPEFSYRLKARIDELWVSLFGVSSGMFIGTYYCRDVTKKQSLVLLPVANLHRAAFAARQISLAEVPLGSVL